MKNIIKRIAQETKTNQSNWKMFNFTRQKGFYKKSAFFRNVKTKQEVWGAYQSNGCMTLDYGMCIGVDG